MNTQFVSALLLASAAITNGFAFVNTHRYTASTTALEAGVKIYYSSSTGNTEQVAEYISKAGGDLPMDDIGDATNEEVEGLDCLIVGAPTWHTGADEQRSGTSWDDWLYTTLPNLKVEGKKVAVFGVGDQQSYGDNFCDAAGELYDLFSAKGCKVFGMTSTEGYDHTESKAEVDGKFVGLMFDEDNQYELSEERAKAWIGQLKSEGFF
ncbi:flavodoxin [Phaeodactylum tricornutum CCAP 1055/1]|jgi:flavodoxin I|uniref:Flavodoxin n=2 Tax=Phaeodactylum tricornutum TaxID=2850 RepID=B7GCM3_PHATC|nr:flavodoxin [Phaeodactylum tricornutum CCAP 1055/1]EEC43635.1 flavodoxin [Phaeodactylum tricornutum CCAP 1055/1]|eukprot:XP_002184899.1 flavodoxin [Phaeodactylum tricornutum CCAP 1055/1]